MSSRRTLILIGAIAIGAFAAFALRNYVQGVENDALEESQPVPVLIATVDIPAGTPATAALQSSIVEKLVPRDVRPSTFVSPQQQDQIAGLIALNDIPANQIIVNGLFVDSTVVQASFTDQIPSGNVAMALNIDQVSAVGGYLQPGDEVNMMVRHENLVCGADLSTESDAGDGEDAEGEQPADEETEIPGLIDQLDALLSYGTWTVFEDPATANEFEIDDEITYRSGDYCTLTKPARYLYQRVEILAIGARQQIQPGDTNASTSVAPAGGTLILSVPTDAAQIIASVEPGDIYLTLLPEDYEAEPLPPLTDRDFFGPLPGEGPLTDSFGQPREETTLTPYGPDGFIEGDLDGAIADDALEGSLTPTDDSENEG